MINGFDLAEACDYAEEGWFSKLTPYGCIKITSEGILIVYEDDS